TSDRLPKIDRYKAVEDIPNAFLPEEPSGRESPVTESSTEEERETGVRCVYLAPKEAEAEELKKLVITRDGDQRPLRRHTSCYSRLGGWHWQPYKPPVPMKIGSLVQQLVTDLPYHEVQIEDAATGLDHVIQELQQLAQNDQIILLIVDAWASYLDRYRRFL